MPVMALPRIRAAHQHSPKPLSGVLTMDVVRALVCVGDLQVGDMPADMVPAWSEQAGSLISNTTHSSLQALPPRTSSRTRACSSAVPQLFLFIIDTMSGAHSPASLSLPSWSEPRSPNVAAVDASASFFWIS